MLDSFATYHYIHIPVVSSHEYDAMSREKEINIRCDKYDLNYMNKRIEQYTSFKDKIRVKDIRDMNLNYMVAFFRTKIEDLSWLEFVRNDYHNHFSVLSDQIEKEKCSLYIPREFDHYIISKLRIFQFRKTSEHESESEITLEIEDPVSGVILKFLRKDNIDFRNNNPKRIVQKVYYEFYSPHSNFLALSKEYYDMLENPKTEPKTISLKKNALLNDMR